MRIIACIFFANLLMAAPSYAGTKLRWTPVDGVFPTRSFGLTASTNTNADLKRRLGVAEECDLIQGARYDAKYSQAERYSLSCRGYPIWGGEIIAKRDANGLLQAVNATIPSNKDVYHIPVLADYLSTLPLQLAAIPESELERGFLMQDGELVPVFKRMTVRGPRSLPYLHYISAILGTPIRIVPQALGSDALVFESNHDDSSRVWRPLDNIGTKLDASSYRVVPDTGARTYAIGGEFEAPENSSAHRQTQVFYAIQKMVDYWQELGVTTPGQIDVMIDSAYGGQTNNALYLPKTATLPAEIHIGPGGGSDNSYAADNDIAQHEFTHHVLDPFIGNSHIESLLLHEGLADFFTAYLNNDSEFAPGIRKNGQPLRSMMLGGEAAIDDPGIDWGIHELSQFLSSTLWEMSSNVENIDELVWEAVTMTGQDTPLEDFFWALELADRDRNGSFVGRNGEESDSFSASSCDIYESAVEFGFTRFLRPHTNTPCGLSLADLTAESKNRKTALFAHLDGLYSGNELTAQNDDDSGCGVIGGVSASKGSIPLPFILLLPLLLLSIRRNTAST
jgi:hypothetical protein